MTALKPAGRKAFWERVWVTLIVGCWAWQAWSQTNFATVATDGGWCWYADPRALFHNGKLYVGYVAPLRAKTALDVFDLSTGANTNLWYSGYSSPDDHNVPGLCVKQDGTLLALYATHGGERFFRYRTSSSTNPVTPEDWSAEQLGPDTGYGLTYVNPFQLSAEGNIIYNFSRDIYFNPTVFTSTDGGSTWSAPQRFIAAGTGGVRPYVKYCSDGVERIDFLYTDGHPRNVANSLYHLYYQGGAFYQTDGTFVRAFANLPILHDSGERGSVIYQYSDAPQSDPDQWIPTGRSWCWEIANQSNGAPVCVFTVQCDLVTGPTSGIDDRIYYYYARWTGSAWQKRFIAHAGRPLYVSEDDYAGGICVDPQDANVVYISSNAEDPFNLGDTTNVPLRANSRYEIWRGVTSDGGLTFAWTQVTTNSTEDNLRPYIPRRNGGEPCVLWFRGTYNTYISFSASIVGLFTTAVPIPPEPPTPPPPSPTTYVDATSGASGNTQAWDPPTQSWVTFTPPVMGSYGADNQWELETDPTWGNFATWFEANREGAEDAPQLRTSVTGLDYATYDVFAYFWYADGQGFVFSAALTNNPSGGLPIYHVGDAPLTPANPNLFSTPDLFFRSGDRSLYQLFLGTVTGTSVTAYIDDEAYGGGNSSIWYDGIGYRLHLATTPTLITLANDGVSMTISWPETHRGWLLQSTTRLDDGWTDIPGSSTNTLVEIPLGTSQPVEFFRLRYPLP